MSQDAVSTVSKPVAEKAAVAVAEKVAATAAPLVEAATTSTAAAKATSSTSTWPTFFICLTVILLVTGLAAGAAVLYLYDRHVIPSPEEQAFSTPEDVRRGTTLFFDGVARLVKEGKMTEAEAVGLKAEFGKDAAVHMRMAESQGHLEKVWKLPAQEQADAFAKIARGEHLLDPVREAIAHPELVTGPIRDWFVKTFNL
jgi:hypothetical protein